MPSNPEGLEMTDEASSSAEPIDGGATSAVPGEVAEFDRVENRDTETAGSDGDGVIEGEELGDTTDDDDDGLVDVEWEGKTYRVTPEIKSGLMTTVDYTRKTQAVAEERKAVEAEREAITARQEAVARQEEFQKANLADIAKLHTISADLAAYQALTDEQWEAIKAKDLDAYREHKDQFRDLKDQRDTLAGQLSTKQQEATAALEKEASEALSTQRRAMADVLTGRSKTDTGHDISIPNLDAERLGKIGKFAAEAYGVSAAELGQITDPRILKALDEARLYRLSVAKSKQVRRVEDSQQTTPAKSVGGAAPQARSTSTPAGDGLATAEWMKRRDQDEAARRAKR